MSVNSSVVNGAPALLVSDWRSAANLIDHTLLKPDATRDQVENFVTHLADWAEKDRNALLCQLNSYASPDHEEPIA